MPDETEEIEHMFPWLPLTVGDVVIVAWDGYSYVDELGRTHWSGAAEPSEADAADAIGNPRTPPLPVPASVTRRQLLLALYPLGVTREAIRAQIGANEAALIDFDEALTFERTHPLVGQLASALGMNTEQVDAIFRAAAQL